MKSITKFIFILCVGIFLSSERNANAQLATFTYTGTQQTWIVPCGVTSVTLECWGAQGANGTSAGGLGGSATGALVVSPGQTLYLYVGGQALFNGGGTGSTGGGNGGDASDVRYGGFALANRVIVAGGGGGGGATNANAPGGTGGGGTCGVNYCGGQGGDGANLQLFPVGGANGGLNGGSGGTGNGSNNGGGGGGGGFTSGGLGGANVGYGSGTAGSLGLGGNAGGPTGSAGGGGGYYGGGGSSGGLNSNAGGGGGSSYTGGVTGGSTVAGIQSGTGKITITWTLPSALSVVGNVVSNELCNGGNNASASETITGGGTPYTYLWTPTAKTTATATGLTVGTYTIKVTDNCGNTATSSVSITQPTAVAVTASTTTNVLCNGGNTGSASSTVSGGTGAYTYSWTGGGTNSTVSGLTAGTYTVTVTDHNGCTGTASATITQPTVLTVTVVGTNIPCNGGTDGSATSTVAGGTSPYTYLWTGGGTNSTVSGLTAGTYTLTVADKNGCTGTAAATITQPTAISLTSTSTPDNGSGNGTATVTASGGTSPYNYLWTPGGKTTAVITSEVHGVYCCKVTDANGCKDSTCVTIKSTAGIDGITSNSGEIVVYPNPNNGQFTIKSSVGGASTVEIYNVLGEKVFTRSLSTTEGTNTIDISNQSTGVYLYRVISVTGDLLGEGKIILQK